MKILFAGEGGQGIQLAAEVLTHAAFLENKPASLIPNFGVEQRGGVSLTFIIIGEDASYPKFDQADILVIFCNRAIERVEKHIGPKTQVLVGPAVTEEVLNSQKLKVDLTLSSKVWNIAAVGNVVRATNLVSMESIKQALKEKLGDKLIKDTNLMELNFKALEK